MIFLRRRRAAGLTLIELLVVIGIIALLLGMLFPVLSRVRTMGVRTKCQNHCNQLMKAVHAYAADNQGYLPHANWLSWEVKGAAAENQKGWLYKYNTTAGSSQFNDPAHVKTGAIYPYLNTLDVYHCPLDGAPWPQGYTRSLASYLMNGVVSCYGDTSKKPYIRARQLPDTTVILWETHEDVTPNNGGDWNDGANSGAQGPPSRHGNGGAVAMLDGSVQWWSQEEFKKELAAVPSRIVGIDPFAP